MGHASHGGVGVIASAIGRIRELDGCHAALGTVGASAWDADGAGSVGSQRDGSACDSGCGPCDGKATCYEVGPDDDGGADASRGFGSHLLFEVVDLAGYTVLQERLFIYLDGLARPRIQEESPSYLSKAL